MSVFTLQGQHHVILVYPVPANRRVRFEVESEHPVTTIVLDAANVPLFQQGKPYVPFGGFQQLQLHRQELTLPFDGSWYLVIMNTSPNPTAVHDIVWS